MAHSKSASSSHYEQTWCTLVHKRRKRNQSFDPPNRHGLYHVSYTCISVTDRRTDDMQSQYRALHYSASRGKKNSVFSLNMMS